MAKYRKVDPFIWNDMKVHRLSDSAKLCFLFLLTHPHMTALGAMRASAPGLAKELGWNLEGFQKAFGEVLVEGMVKYDDDACLVWLPNFIKYNPPESPNVVKAWVGSMDLLPECDLKTLTLQRAKAFLEGMSEGFRKALPEAFREALAKAMPYQEQEQEQESNTLSTEETCTSAAPDSKASPKPSGKASAKPTAKPSPSPSANDRRRLGDFRKVFDAYPHTREPRETAWEDGQSVWLDMLDELPSLKALLESLMVWIASEDWKQNEGQYIPSFANWLRKRRFKASPKKRVPTGDIPHQSEDNGERARTAGYLAERERAKAKAAPMPETVRRRFLEPGEDVDEETRRAELARQAEELRAAV